MAFWAAARFQPKHERLALHFLKLYGFETYLPRLREQRIRQGRRVEVTPPLFPGYAFVVIELQWHAPTGTGDARAGYERWRTGACVGRDHRRASIARAKRPD